MEFENGGTPYDRGGSTPGPSAAYGSGNQLRPYSSRTQLKSNAILPT